MKMRRIRRRGRRRGGIHKLLPSPSAPPSPPSRILPFSSPVPALLSHNRLTCSCFVCFAFGLVSLLVLVLALAHHLAVCFFHRSHSLRPSENPDEDILFQSAPK